MNDRASEHLSAESLIKAIADYNEQRELVAEARKKGTDKIYKQLVPLLVVLVIAVGALAFNDYLNTAFIIVGLGGFGLFIAFTRKKSGVDAPAEKLQAQMRERVLPTIFSEIKKLNFESNVNGFVDEIPESIMPSFNTSEWGDLIQGEFHGLNFAINEIHLKHKSGDSDSNETTVFKGVAINIKRQMKAPETLIVRNNRMAMTQWLSKKTGLGLDVPRIEFANNGFEKRYDVHCYDENFARKVFSKDGIDLCQAMQEKFASGNFQFVATGSNVYMLIEQDYDFFELPPIDQPFDENVDVPRLRVEIEGFLALFDDMEKLLAA